MGENILAVAEKCRELAEIIRQSAEDAVEAEETEHDALMRLYYAERLVVRLEACREQMTEETEEQTAAAVFDAQDAVSDAEDAAFGLVAALAPDVEGVTLNSGGDSLPALLKKLYVCTDILRTAYQCSTRHTMYGINGPRNFAGWTIGNAFLPDDLCENEPVQTPYEYFNEQVIELDQISDARRRLIGEIEKIAKE